MRERFRFRWHVFIYCPAVGYVTLFDAMTYIVKDTPGDMQGSIIAVAEFVNHVAKRRCYSFLAEAIFSPIFTEVSN